MANGSTNQPKEKIMGTVFKNLCLGAWVVVLALLMNSTLPPQQVEWRDENNNPHQETVAQNKYAMCGVLFLFASLPEIKFLA